MTMTLDAWVTWLTQLYATYAPTTLAAMAGASPDPAVQTQTLRRALVAEAETKLTLCASRFEQLKATRDAARLLPPSTDPAARATALTLLMEEAIADVKAGMLPDTDPGGTQMPTDLSSLAQFPNVTVVT